MRLNLSTLQEVAVVSNMEKNVDFMTVIYCATVLTFLSYITTEWQYILATLPY